MAIDVIKITWKDQTGTLNADEAFLAAEAIEDHVPVFELANMLADPKNLKTAKLARAYAAMCNIAGIHVTEKEVRSEIAGAFGSGNDPIERGTSFMAAASGVIAPLLQILTDGADMGGDEQSADEAQAAGNQSTPTS